MINYDAAEDYKHWRSPGIQTILYEALCIASLSILTICHKTLFKRYHQEVSKTKCIQLIEETLSL